MDSHINFAWTENACINDGQWGLCATLFSQLFVAHKRLMYYDENVTSHQSPQNSIAAILFNRSIVMNSAIIQNILASFVVTAAQTSYCLYKSNHESSSEEECRILI